MDGTLGVRIDMLDLYGMISDNIECNLGRFFIGTIGTITYFMCVKYGVLDFKFEDPDKNEFALVNNKTALVFFCFVGGLIPCLMDIQEKLGWFFQGFTLRATLLSMYFAAQKEGKIPEIPKSSEDL